jgi:hypothetical protein
MSMAISRRKTANERICSGTLGAFNALNKIEKMTACSVLQFSSFLGSSYASLTGDGFLYGGHGVDPALICPVCLALRKHFKF